MEPVSEALSQKFKNMAIVCAILVVFIHIPMKAAEPGEVLWVFKMLISEGISKIAVPFFFLASGYFLAGHIGENGWWKRELRKRVRTLLVPFILWNAVYLLFGVVTWFATTLLIHRAFGVSSRIVHNPELWFLGLNPFYPATLPVLWYVRTLLLLVLASPAIVWALKRFPRVFILGAWVFSFIAIANDFDGVNYLLRFVVECGRGLVYFSLGIFLRWNPIRVKGRKLWMWSVVIALALLGIRLGESYAGGTLGTYLTTFSIPFMLYAVWGLIPEKPWAKGFTSLAFPCYVIHFFILDALHAGFAVLMGSFGFSQNVQWKVEPWFLLAFAVPLTLFLAHAMYRYFPKTSGVLFGGR